MERRQYLAVLAGMVSVAGCTGRQDETITMLAVNEDHTSHVVTVWAVHHEKLTVAKTVDGDVVLANKFRSEDWFNQLDVFIDEDSSVELNRGRAA